MKEDMRLVNALTIAGISEEQQEAIFLHVLLVDPPPDICGMCKHRRSGPNSPDFCYRKHEGREIIRVCEDLPACDKYEEINGA